MEKSSASKRDVKAEMLTIGDQMAFELKEAFPKRADILGLIQAWQKVTGYEKIDKFGI